MPPASVHPGLIQPDAEKLHACQPWRRGAATTLLAHGERSEPWVSIDVAFQRAKQAAHIL